MATLKDYLMNRADSDSAIKALEAAIDEIATEQERQKSITDYNIMMGTLEDPEEAE